MDKKISLGVMKQYFTLVHLQMTTTVITGQMKILVLSQIFFYQSMVTVWCEMTFDRIAGPIFFCDAMNVKRYLTVLQEKNLASKSIPERE